MTPALGLIIMLQNAISTCEGHQHMAPPVAWTVAPKWVYGHGFEQCVYLVPAAQKYLTKCCSPPSTAQMRKNDEATVAKAVAALAAARPIDWKKFNAEAAKAAAKAAQR